MIEILLFFLLASLLLYVLLGGADFGAGVLEILPLPRDQRRHQQKIVNQAMGPVWEANHMWLIIMVVLLFMGFPFVFTSLMTSLHFPVLALLVGVVGRGCAFTFRHYDAYITEQSQKLYTWTFALSSLWTSLWLGILAASLYRGGIRLEYTNFFDSFVAPWWGLHPFSMGIFTTTIFAYLASSYLIGETTDSLMRRIFRRRALLLNALVCMTGGLVFLTSYLEGGRLLQDFLGKPLPLLFLIVASLLMYFFVKFLKYEAVWWIRVCAGGQITCIVLGWLSIYAPAAFHTTSGTVSYYEAAAPHPTLVQLLIALLVGSCFIFPSLLYLLKIFKSSSDTSPPH